MASSASMWNASMAMEAPPARKLVAVTPANQSSPPTLQAGHRHLRHLLQQSRLISAPPLNQSSRRKSTSLKCLWPTCLEKSSASTTIPSTAHDKSPSCFHAFRSPDREHPILAAANEAENSSADPRAHVPFHSRHHCRCWLRDSRRPICLACPKTRNPFSSEYRLPGCSRPRPASLRSAPSSCAIARDCSQTVA